MGVLSFIPLWAIVVTVIVVVIIILFRTMNQVYVLSLLKKNIFYIILIGFLIILVISILNIHKNNDFDLSTMDGVRGAVKIYFNWFASIGRNVVKVTGYAINQDWIAAGNSTSGGGG